MHHSLARLISDNQIGFNDIIEAYAQMCIDSVHDITTDMVSDEGVDGLVKQGMDLSVDGLTGQAVDWALVCAPEMLRDVVNGVEKKPNESWLEYVLRVAVIKRVKETKAFQVQFS